MRSRDGIFGEAGLGWAARVANAPLVLLILLYRVTLSPFIGGQCRFEPTCSRYALTALRRYGPLRGAWLAAGRIGRCHPFHGGGYDPVPFPERTAGSTPIDSPGPACAGQGEMGCAPDEPPAGRQAT
ncbi:MAG: membrane protein insertion efficiency factor YidD [Phycisphaerales bacterium]|nr:membrane protein insertion efficiency factor YidD [Phycisphaerales bacterium]